MTSSRIEINEQFSVALNLMEQGRGHVFVTGKAGTGKSTLLNYFRETTKKEIVVLAPTGVAAVNIKGQTIHSFFRFKPDVTVEKAEDIARRLAVTKRGEVYRKMDALVIDEISMVRADLFDCIDSFLRVARGARMMPFGGVQLIMIGDLYQLPPVVSSKEREIFSGHHYESPYFFDAHAFEEMNPSLVELEKIYRQSDEQFISILNSIRNNTVTDEQLELLNEKYMPDFEPKDGLYIHLTTINKAADEINLARLARLGGRAEAFHAETEGEFRKEAFPAEEMLQLKRGAQVMLLNNDPRGRWVNGSIGEVVALGPDAVEVRLADGKREWVGQHTWELFHYDYDQAKRRIESVPIGSFTQMPLKLAWAITIHKAQGKTFDRMIVDLGRGTFAPGQLYVALSRCRSLEGMVLKTRIAKRHAMLDYRVVGFLTRYQYDESERSAPLDDKVVMIETAIENGHKLAITYLKNSDDKSHRIVVPREVGEMEYSGRTFLGMRGLCLKRNELRVFRVDRILKVELLK